MDAGEWERMEGCISEAEAHLDLLFVGLGRTNESIRAEQERTAQEVDYPRLM